MKVVRNFAVVLALVGWGCVPDWASDNQTGLFMEIADISSIRGADDDAGEVLYSDVSDGFNDDAIITVNIYRKNPTVNSTSALEHVRLERYEVRYTRSDGRNREGVDVPFRFTGPLNERFHTPTGTGEIEIEAVATLVRHQAKFEPPLSTLVGVTPTPNQSFVAGGPGIITTIAEITVHARQVTTGEPLRASGRIQVTFADFVGDEDE